MRSNLPFDTHAFVKKLVAAGVPEPQAEVHAEALGEMVIERLSTKDDLLLLKQELRAELNELRGEMREMELRIKNDLTLRFGAMLAAAVAIMAALIKLL